MSYTYFYLYTQLWIWWVNLAHIFTNNRLKIYSNFLRRVIKLFIILNKLYFCKITLNYSEQIIFTILLLYCYIREQISYKITLLSKSICWMMIIPSQHCLFLHLCVCHASYFHGYYLYTNRSVSPRLMRYIRWQTPEITAQMWNAHNTHYWTHPNVVDVLCPNPKQKQQNKSFVRELPK